MAARETRQYWHPCWPQLPALLPVWCFADAEDTAVSEKKTLEGFAVKSNPTELGTPAFGIQVFYIYY